MVINVHGDILRSPDVVFVGNPPPAGSDADCDAINVPRIPDASGRRAGKSVKYIQEGDAPLTQGWGDILSGYFTVTSRHHKANVKTGHYQVAYDSSFLATDSPAKPIGSIPAGAYVTTAGKINLAFYKSESY